MKSHALLPLLLLLPILPLAGEEALRDWTNTEGKTITAELIEVQDDTVILRMENGRRYPVDLATLSQADRDYAAQWLANHEAREKGEAMETKIGFPTKAIVESTFDEDAPPTRKSDLAGWNAGIGEWRIEEGILIGDELPENNHASSFTHRFEAENLIVKARVQLGSATQIAIACRDNVPPNEHLGRLYITPEKLWIQSMSGIAGTTKAERLTTLETDIDPGEWYDVTIEIVGDRYRAKVGDEELEATHSRFADAKGIIALVNSGQGAKFDNVSIWHAEAKE